jgi:hypothetical protein
MRALVLSLLLVAVGWDGTRAAGAQQQPATIPTDLALALLENSADAYGGRAAKIMVGQAPAGVPASLTSADGAVVLGGVEFPGRAVVILSFTQPPSEVLQAFDKQLVARGWAPPPLANERGGFVPGNFSSPLGNVYCSDSSVAMMASLPAPGGGTYVRIQHTRNNGRSICTPQRYAQMSNMPSLKFPTLLPPVGMEQRGAGAGMGSGRDDISTRLVGSRAPVDVLTHYVKQLETAGWKMGAPIGADAVAAASASTKDSNGTDWNGAIYVTRVTPAEVEVTIHMLRPSDR